VVNCGSVESGASGAISNGILLAAMGDQRRSAIPYNQALGNS